LRIIEVTEPAPTLLPETQVHESLRAQIHRGEMTLDQANATLTGTPYQPLASIAPEPAAAPAVALTPEQAAAQIDALKRDKGFYLDFINGVSAAKQKWAGLHKQASGEAPAAISAMEELDALKNDPAFREALANNDADAIAKWKAANQAAYPDSPADATLDRFPPAAQPHEIKIPSLAEAQAAAVAEGHAQGGGAELLTAVTLARTYAVAAELPAADASAIAADIARIEPQWRKFSERERETHTTNTMAKLTSRWGAKTADMVGLARLVAHEASKKHPALLDFIADSGAGSDFGVIARLAEHGARLAAKKGRTIESLRAQFPRFFALDWVAS
jgi:hypothetical protein